MAPLKWKSTTWEYIARLLLKSKLRYSPHNKNKNLKKWLMKIYNVPGIALNAYKTFYKNRTWVLFLSSQNPHVV